MRADAVGVVHQSAVTNFMQLQSTYTPHLQYFLLEANLETSRKFEVELFSRNSQHVKGALAIFTEELHREEELL